MEDVRGRRGEWGKSIIVTRYALRGGRLCDIWNFGTYSIFDMRYLIQNYSIIYESISNILYWDFLPHETIKRKRH